MHLRFGPGIIRGKVALLLYRVRALGCGTVAIVLYELYEDPGLGILVNVSNVGEMRWLRGFCISD